MLYDTNDMDDSTAHKSYHTWMWDAHITAAIMAPAHQWQEWHLTVCRPAWLFQQLLLQLHVWCWLLDLLRFVPCLFVCPCMPALVAMVAHIMRVSRSPQQ